MLQVTADPQRLEALLAEGRVLCPDCREPLAAWGFASARAVRTLGGDGFVRQRRGCCRACGRTHVLIPVSLVARRLDSAEVIGEALRLAALGHGHRSIAQRLGRAPDTVRGWLRSARRNANELRHAAARWYVALDVQPRPVTPAGSVIGDLVETLLLAVQAARLRFGRDRLGPWERAQHLIGGLLSAAPLLPP